MFKTLKRLYTRFIVSDPKCDCGEKLNVDTDECMTSFPCQHAATCPKCGKHYTVYGIGHDDKKFTRSWEEALKLS